ncbi:uncharacterized protein LOC144115376 [Amblyomma americanum]
MRGIIPILVLDLRSLLPAVIIGRVHLVCPAVPQPAKPEPTSPLTPVPSPALTTRHVDMTTLQRPETPPTMMLVKGLQQPTLHGAAFSGPRHLFPVPGYWLKIVPTSLHLGLQAESH